MKRQAENERRRHRLATHFTSMLSISAFTFGGGFVIVTLMKRRFVDELSWLDDQEMLDLTALAQSAPGPIAVNAAIQVGWRVAGFPGMLAAVAGTALPPLVILSILSRFYALFAANPWVALALKGLQAGVAAVIFDVVLSMGGKVLRDGSWLHTALMIAAFVATWCLRVNVVLVIAAAAAIGAALALVGARRAGT